MLTSIIFLTARHFQLLKMGKKKETLEQISEDWIKGVKEGMKIEEAVRDLSSAIVLIKTGEISKDTVKFYDRIIKQAEKAYAYLIKMAEKYRKVPEIGNLIKGAPDMYARFLRNYEKRKKSMRKK